MSINTDSVVVVGSGPVGLATACMLKCMNKDVKITVFDKRTEATRKHGLYINWDTTAVVSSVLTAGKLSYEDVFATRLRSLRAQFMKWTNAVVRTNEIENTLIKIAKQLNIAVYRGPDYDATPVLNNTPTEELTDNQRFIKKSLEEASVIIGADGAHSEVRKNLMEDDRAEEHPLGYLVEFKFQTALATRPRSKWEALTSYFKSGFVDFEVMRKRSAETEEESKSGTLNIIVSKSTYDLLRQYDDKNKVIKGDFQTPWNENELREYGQGNPEIEKVLAAIRNYREDIRNRGGECKNTTITTIPLETYRSKEVAKKIGKQIVLLAGDASGGLVLGRGLNKGFHEAAQLSHFVTRYFHKKSKGEEKAATKCINDYKVSHIMRFKYENFLIKIQMIGIKSLGHIVDLVSRF